MLLAAYRGTVDDEGEDADDAIGEVERTVGGQYGPFVPIHNVEASARPCSLRAETRLSGRGTPSST